jgi:uncharacterized cysteine cluster protein YcgN (CxxCxxCC family)
MTTCGCPAFAVRLNVEHNCMARVVWYYDHKMTWFVEACRRRVEREEREFWRMLNKLNKELEESKEQRQLLVDTESW